MNIYLGHWEWTTHRTENAWAAPGGNALGVFDLRSIPQQSVAGGTPQGYGLFVYDSPQTQSLLLESLGDAPDVLLRPREANAMNALLGVSLARDTLSRMLRQALLDPAITDASGLTRWKPLRFTVGRRCQFSIGGFGWLWDETVDDSHPAIATSAAVFRADYKRQRDFAETRGSVERDRIINALQRYTGSTMQKLYRRMDDATADAILPPEYRLDGWRVPQTTFTETWPTNSTTISTGQDQPWTETANDVQVSSNKLQPVTDASVARARCGTQLSTDDHSHEASYEALGTANVYQCLAGVRNDGSTDDLGYGVWVRRFSGSDSQLVKREPPTAHSVLSEINVDPGATGTVQCQANGSSISGIAGGNTHTPVTDTTHTGQLNVWLGFYNNNTKSDTTLDNHTAADLGRVMGSLAGLGGLAGSGGLAGRGGGLAG